MPAMPKLVHAAISLPIRSVWLLSLKDPKSHEPFKSEGLAKFTFAASLSNRKPTPRLVPVGCARDLTAAPARLVSVLPLHSNRLAQNAVEHCPWTYGFALSFDPICSFSTLRTCYFQETRFTKKIKKKQKSIQELQ